MAATTFMDDVDFDALVEDLRWLSHKAQSGEVESWEIRVALAEHGVLPLRVAEIPAMEDSLVASLRSIGRHEAERRAARAA